MKHTKTAKTTLDPDLAKRALDADMGNALKAINNGQLLPKYRREQLEAIAAGRPSPSSTTFAANYAGLAAALGCTRQRLAYWTRQPDAPKPREDGRHDVGAWRAYLAARGRLPSAAGTPQPDADDRRPRVRMDWGDACDAAIDAVGDALPRALAASGISATDKAVLGLWLVLAAAIDARATSWNFPSYFEAGEAGKVGYPEAIERLASKVITASAKP